MSGVLGNFDPSIEFRCALCGTRNPHFNQKCHSCEEPNRGYNKEKANKARESAPKITAPAPTIFAAPAPLAFGSGGFSFQPGAPLTTSTGFSSTANFGSITSTSSTPNTGFVFTTNFGAKPDSSLSTVSFTTSTTQPTSNTSDTSSSTTKRKQPAGGYTQSNDQFHVDKTKRQKNSPAQVDDEEEQEQVKSIKSTRTTRGRKVAEVSTETQSIDTSKSTRPTRGRPAATPPITTTNQSEEDEDNEENDDNNNAQSNDEEAPSLEKKKRGRPKKDPVEIAANATARTVRQLSTRVPPTDPTRVERRGRKPNVPKKPILPDIDELPFYSLSSTLTSPIPRPAYYGNGIPMTFGAGDCAQLGLGFSEDESLRVRKFPAVLKHLSDVNIVSVAAGALHNLALSADGKVYSWGCNDDGALGRLTPNDLQEFAPDLVSGLENERIVAIAAGASHSLALSDNGQVFSWGAYRDAGGLIGFNPEHLRVFEAMSVPGLDRVYITRIACGESHCLALADTGEVYYWGDIFIGRRQSDRRKTQRLHPQSIQFKCSPSQMALYGIEGKEKTDRLDITITHIFAGGYTSCAISASGLLWIWGPNNYVQCGIAADFCKDGHQNRDESPAVISPTIVPFFFRNGLRVIGGACSNQFSLILTEDRRVFAFGRSAEGRLGQVQNYNWAEKGQQSEPLEIIELSPRALSSPQSWNQPTSDMVTTQTDKLFKGPKNDCIVGLSCGEAHCLAITAQGRLFGWGVGDCLQLGNGLEQTQFGPYWIRSHQISTLPRSVLLADCGSQHSIILTKSIDSRR